MSEFRLSPEAEAELDSIWLHIARESGSVDVATRVVEGITERFWLLARHPYIGRRRTPICAQACAASADDYVILHTVADDDVVLILHVVHGSQDIVTLLSH